MKNFQLNKTFESQSLSFTLSIVIHVIALYFIGSWVVELGIPSFIQKFIITEITLENRSITKVAPQAIAADPQIISPSLTTRPEQQ